MIQNVTSHRVACVSMLIKHVMVVFWGLLVLHLKLCILQVASQKLTANWCLIWFENCTRKFVFLKISWMIFISKDKEFKI